MKIKRKGVGKKMISKTRGITLIVTSDCIPVWFKGLF